MRIKFGIITAIVGAVVAVIIAIVLFNARTARQTAVLPDPLVETLATPTAELATLAPPTATLEPTPTSTVEPPTATPAPTETAVPRTAELLFTTLSNDLDFASYQFDFVFNFVSLDENGVEQEQNATVNYLFQQEPHAEGLTAVVSGLEGDLPTTEVQLFSVDGTSYAVLPSLGCVAGMSQLAQLAEPFTDAFSPESLARNINDAERILPDEEINGILTEHYRFDETMFESDNAELESGEGHLYIAVDGGYVVRFIVDGEGDVVSFGTGGEAENGRLHAEYNLSNVNAPIEITLPASCPAS